MNVKMVFIFFYRTAQSLHLSLFVCEYLLSSVYCSTNHSNRSQCVFVVDLFRLQIALDLWKNKHIFNPPHFVNNMHAHVKTFYVVWIARPYRTLLFIIFVSIVRKPLDSISLPLSESTDIFVHSLIVQRAHESLSRHTNRHPSSIPVTYECIIKRKRIAISTKSSNALKLEQKNRGYQTKSPSPQMPLKIKQPIYINLTFNRYHE